MEYKTGEFVWITGYLHSRVSELEDLRENKLNTNIVGKYFDTASPTAHYRYIDQIVYDTPKAALVLGHSRRYTGVISSSTTGYYNEFAGYYLDQDRLLKVLMVMPLGNRPNQYHAPIPVLVTQIRKMENDE